MVLQSKATIRILNTKQNTLGVTFPPSLSNDSLFPFQKGDKVDIMIVKDKMLITKVIKDIDNESKTLI